ncbi:hypothetical protein [Aequorivita echinoideorum]|uniref:Lamin Tail Domain n=1 Tax=Aequorivita echinoideorum TaxID=1549647 RepID=A0ABS5S676_9FLAO|nr:hypothetical protein [Aequorivita echinoideorum]MBT0608698.1 hypothetical protein [Aequorivita echinoideorum]
MKHIILSVIFGLTVCILSAQVGIGTTNPSAAAMLEVSSQTDGNGPYLGFMPPRVPNVSARDAIAVTAADVGLMVFVKSIGCLQMWDGSHWESVQCLNSIPIEPWINEFHYDNIGTDSGEFVEIAGPAGLDLNGYRIILYNGADGTSYDSFQLSGIIDNESNSYGALGFTRPNIQNGSPDGIALVKTSNNQILQFISYEGAFSASNGPAQGASSIDIGYSESDLTPTGNSLQLIGTGNQCSHFTWSAPATASPESLNAGQNIN